VADEKLDGWIAEMPLLPALKAGDGNQHRPGKYQQGRHDNRQQGWIDYQQYAGKYEDYSSSHVLLRLR
jgi:hypothetical protein